MKTKKVYFKINPFSNDIIEHIINAKVEKIKNTKRNPQKKIKNSLNSLFSENFYGIALDFDGTLIPLEKRLDTIKLEIINVLSSINENKIPIFILSGRGSSLLRQFPIDTFKNLDFIYIAQYNGGRILKGDGKLLFEFDMGNLKEYSEIKHFLKRNNINFKEKISSFVIPHNENFEFCHSFISNFKKWQILSTNYSFDIFPTKISKLTALKFACKLLKISKIKSILKIGDAGGLKGNDYDFLRCRNSFSVGDYSPILTTNFPIFNSQNEMLTGPIGVEFILNNIIL